jgi:hypothetical protein
MKDSFLSHGKRLVLFLVCMHLQTMRASDLGSLRRDISRARNDLAWFLLDIEGATGGANLYTLPDNKILRLTESCSCLTIPLVVLLKTCKSLASCLMGNTPCTESFVQGVASNTLRQLIQKKSQHGDVFLVDSASAKKQSRGHKTIVGDSKDLPAWVIHQAESLWSAKAKVAARHFAAPRLDLEPPKSNMSTIATPLDIPLPLPDVPPIARLVDGHSSSS